MNQTTKDFEQRIIRIISELSAVAPDDIRPEDRLREDLALDSVASMELVSALAEEFDLEIEMEEAMEVHTVAAVMEMARNRLDSRKA